MKEHNPGTKATYQTPTSPSQHQENPTTFSLYSTMLPSIAILEKIPASTSIKVSHFTSSVQLKGSQVEKNNSI
jgi:hypothetical protein